MFSKSSRILFLRALLLSSLTVFHTLANREHPRIPIQAGGSIEVRAGTPPQSFNLLLDIGSGGTWLKSANSKYLYTTGNARTFNESESSSYQVDGRRWRTEYASGLLLKGQLVKDKFNLAGLSIEDQIFGLCQFSEGFRLDFFELDGAIGLGSRLRPAVNVLDPVQNLFKQQKIEQEMFSIHLSREAPQLSGTLVLGGIDEQFYTGEITYAPIETRWSFFVDHVYESSKTDGGTRQISTWREAVLDSTSNIIEIPADDLDNMRTKSAAYLDYNLMWHMFPSCDALDQEPDLILEFEGRNFTIPGKDLVIKLMRNETQEECYSALAPSDDKIILGYPFLRNYYTIYDYASKRIGFAEQATDN